jgi:hypothetical protein
LRELYVNVAEYDFALQEKKQTDSRVSLLTGIHRKEVRRLRGAGAPVNVVPVAVSRTSLILARWLGDPQFTDAAGKPLPLPRWAEPPAPSFEQLVESVTRDVRSRAVLDEWLDRKLVTLDEEDRAVLVGSGYVPGPGDDQQLYYFGRNLHDHMAAAVANVEGDAPQFLERAVHYDHLPEEVANHLLDRSREVALELLQKVNREAHVASDAAPSGEWRWSFGVYVYSEQVVPQPDQPRNDFERGNA